MSLRLQILQVARLAPRLLGESTESVRRFASRQFTESGGACDRAGKPDLYYAIFALATAQALDAPVPEEKVASWLSAFGDGAGLDFVHCGALARCWAAIGLERMPASLADRIIARVEQFRKPDGGYDGDTKLLHGTAYGAFVALGAYQDLGKAPPRPLELARGLSRLRSGDGAWANHPGMTSGSMNATAGAVTLIRHLGLPVDASVADWLLRQTHPQGGFKAAPEAPIPDLLSTATALHALSSMDRRVPSTIHEGCLDFLDTLWSAEGGFHGHWADDFLDPEYTFYGLLALGHLSL